MRSTASAAPPSSVPAESLWAVLTKEDLTWRQATEGWAILATLGVFGLAAGALFKVARSLGRSRA
jgi:hypothetical protein